MNTIFNKIMSLVIIANIFCAFITLLYFTIDIFHPNTLYLDDQLKTINCIFLILVNSLIMDFANHFSKKIVLDMKKDEIFYHDLDNFDFVINFIYKFALLSLTLLNLILWINIIDNIF